ncbi:MAG TPA: hypothetical protein VFG43_09605, partial [Geminicoccaceae bacterium]|nr:hypothetical protein [Geminicoccaceae bacterium]
RVLHPNGVFLADVLAGYDEGFTPGEFEAMHWRSIETLAGQICRVGGFNLASRRDLGQIRRDRWTQIVFRVQH